MRPHPTAFQTLSEPTTDNAALGVTPTGRSAAVSRRPSTTLIALRHPDHSSAPPTWRLLVPPT